MNIRHAPCLSLLFAFITALPTLHAADDASPLLPRDNKAALVEQANRLLDALSTRSETSLLLDPFNQYLGALEKLLATVPEPTAVDVQLSETTKLAGKVKAVFNRVYEGPQSEPLTKFMDQIKWIERYLDKVLDKATEGEREVTQKEKYTAFLVLNTAIYILMTSTFYRDSNGKFTNEQTEQLARATTLLVWLENKSLALMTLKALCTSFLNSLPRCSIQ